MRTRENSLRGTDDRLSDFDLFLGFLTSFIRNPYVIPASRKTFPFSFPKNLFPGAKHGKRLDDTIDRYPQYSAYTGFTPSLAPAEHGRLANALFASFPREIRKIFSFT
jgi:hypothetical protein